MTDIPRIVVAGFVYRRRADGQAEFLLMQRPSDSVFFPDVWVAPGGGVEPSDFAADRWGDGDGRGVLVTALARELGEECGDGLLFGRPRLFADRGFVRDDGRGIMVLSYVVPWEAGEPVLTREAKAFVWVTADEASGYDLIGNTLVELHEAARILAA